MHAPRLRHNVSWLWKRCEWKGRKARVKGKKERESAKVNAGVRTMPKRKYSRLEWSVLMSLCIFQTCLSEFTLASPFNTALHLSFHPWAQGFFLLNSVSPFWQLKKVSGFITKKNTVKAYPPRKTFLDYPHCRRAVWKSRSASFAYKSSLVSLNASLELESRLVSLHPLAKGAG